MTLPILLLAAMTLMFLGLFGTYREAKVFTELCGFPGGVEHRLADMLSFRDVYDREYA
jgi:hypothetical protein